MTREVVSSDEAPVALGPYSQAIVAGGFVFCSGMAGIDPATGTIPEGIEAQTDQALVNLAAVLGAAVAVVARLTASRGAPCGRVLGHADCFDSGADSRRRHLRQFLANLLSRHGGLR